MKALILSLAVVFSATSFAFGSFDFAPGPIPNDNDWSLGKVSSACAALDYEFALDNYTGAKQKAEGKGWYYYALDGEGNAIFASYSTSRYVWGKNTCLTE